MAKIIRTLTSADDPYGPELHFGTLKTAARYIDLVEGLGHPTAGIDSSRWNLLIENRHQQRSVIQVSCIYGDYSPDTRLDMNARWKDPELSLGDMTRAIHASLRPDWDGPFDWTRWTTPDETA